MARPTSSKRFVYKIEQALTPLIGTKVEDNVELENQLSAIINSCTSYIQYVSGRVYYHEGMIVGDLEIQKQMPLFRIDVEKESSEGKMVITSIQIIPLYEDEMDHYIHEYIREVDQLEILRQLDQLERREDYIEDEKELQTVRQRIELLNRMLI